MKQLTIPGLVATLVFFVAECTCAADRTTCDGEFRGRSVPPDELQKVLELHHGWLVESKGDYQQKGADPRRANLCGADLSELHLEGVILDRANLQGAKMNRVTTRKRADGQRGTPASFAGADLRGAWFMEADLEYASFGGADLSGAVFIRADLTKANFGAAKLTGADLSRADVSGVLFEPQPGALPTISRLTDTRGLSHVEFTSPHAVAELREGFKKAALRDQEREVTYAIKRHEVNQTNPVERAFNWLLFDITSQYGMRPGRPLWILLILVFVFAIPYWIALRSTNTGIWIVWPKERLPGRPGSDLPEKLTRPALAGIPFALYFSLLSAASIGWKDLNVGSWLARVQSDEYSLKPSGWVRTVSGVQSLVSVYLLALWALTYFGRPFE